MREVDIAAIPLDRLASFLSPDRGAQLAEYAERGRRRLEGRTVWNVNATATGGGVAEMLEALLAYGRGARVHTRWLVLDGTPEFFRFTKRIHNLLHGVVGDGGRVGQAEREIYEAVLTDNLVHLRQRVRAGDIVLLHDPQTALLVRGLADAGAHVVWRCHVGRDTPNALTHQAWSFLRADVEQAEAVIFSRRAYVPEWVEPDRVWLIPPSLDPFSTKNCELPVADVEASLRQSGLVQAAPGPGSLAFARRDGSSAADRRRTDLVTAGGTVPEAPGSSCRSVAGTGSRTWPAC